jgi:hypothetical protein
LFGDLGVSRAFLEKPLQDLNANVQSCVVKLIFNLDEVRIADLGDRRTRKLVIPAAMLPRLLHHGVSRNVQHISITACISTAGESRPPHTVTPENASLVQEYLRKHAVRFGRDVIMACHQRPYINADSFLYDIKTIFFLHLIGFRGLV